MLLLSISIQHISRSLSWHSCSVLLVFVAHVLILLIKGFRHPFPRISVLYRLAINV